VVQLIAADTVAVLLTVVDTIEAAVIMVVTVADIIAVAVITVVIMAFTGQVSGLALAGDILISVSI
jgi:hypothetical protein